MMKRILSLKLIAAMSVLVALTACVSKPARQMDYTAFRNSKPSTILVLPPVNDTTDVGASCWRPRTEWCCATDRRPR